MHLFCLFSHQLGKHIRHAQLFISIDKVEPGSGFFLAHLFRDFGQEAADFTGLFLAVFFARIGMQDYDVRPVDPALKTAKFSGGNQQKIVLAREIERAPKVLLVGQPTRGVDIGAIEFIHRRLIALRDQGVAILLVSVELEEVMALSDRILALCGGQITGEREAVATDERDLGLLMAGVSERAA